MSELLSISQQKTIQTIMEIPTYPYYKEQLNVAPNKLKGGLSLVWNYLGDRLYEKNAIRLQ